MFPIEACFYCGELAVAVANRGDPEFEKFLCLSHLDAFNDGHYNSPEGAVWLEDEEVSDEDAE